MTNNDVATAARLSTRGPRFTRRRRWPLIAAQLAVVAITGMLALPLTAPTDAVAVTPGTEVPVSRWWQPTDRDWVGIPAGGTHPSESQLVASGYAKAAPPQFYVHLNGSAAEGMVQVHRWWNAADRDWVDITAGSIADAALTAFGYTGKTAQYWLYRESGPGRVAVNRWWSATDRDWVTLRQDEIPDASLVVWGYTGKTLLGYAATEPSVPTAHLALTAKVVSAVGEPAAADAWTLAAAGPTPISGAGGVVRTEVKIGTYRLSQTGSLPGYTNGATWECVNAATRPIAVVGNTITLATGDDVTCTITNTRFPDAPAPGRAAPTAVIRHWHPDDRDWVGVAEHPWQLSAAGLEAAGYTDDEGPQFWVPMIGTNDPALVAIHRWWHPGDRDWVDVADGSLPESTLVASGYAAKTFQYYLYNAPGAGRVAVNRWWSVADRDWVTLREGEYPEALLTAWGYTNKVRLGWAIGDKRAGGYFTLGDPQARVVPLSLVSGKHLETFSVVDVNAARDPGVNKGYRFRGYVSHSGCGGVYVARANDPDADPWVQDPLPVTFDGAAPCGWGSAALLPDGRVALVTDGVAGRTITARISTDGLEGMAFGPATVLVDEAGAVNGQASLFMDPASGAWHLFWAREKAGVREIRVKTASTFLGLVGSGPTDIGTAVAFAGEPIGAPSVVSVGGVYYLTVQTVEAGVVRTRALSSTAPTGPYYEVADNPVFGKGAGCVFQHVFGHELHSYFCAQATPGDATRTLDHVAANLLGQPPGGGEPVDCSVEQCVALTFDDGTPTYFLSILDALEAGDARGTFFLVGSSVKPKFPVVQRMASLGNEVGIHAWDVRDLTVLDEAAITSQFSDSVAAVASVTGSAPGVARPPYGMQNAKVRGVAEKLGLAIALWSLDPPDPLYADPAELRSHVAKNASRGAIIVLRGDLSATPRALPGIITDLKGAGFTLVTVSELLGDPEPGQVYSSQP